MNVEELQEIFRQCEILDDHRCYEWNIEGFTGVAFDTAPEQREFVYHKLIQGLKLIKLLEKKIATMSIDGDVPKIWVRDVLASIIEESKR